MFAPHRLKRIRGVKGLTQKQLAEKCGINEANLRKYENGRQTPKIETIKKIASALEIDWRILDTTKNEFDDDFKYAESSEADRSKYSEKLMESHNDFEKAFENANRERNNKILQDHLLLHFKWLNTKGKNKAIERVSRLTMNWEYTIPDKEDDLEEAVNEIAQNNNNVLTSLQFDFIKKYRNLDDHGKKIIDYCLNEEYDRCVAAQTEQEEPEIISIKFAYLPASAGTGIDLSEENYSSLKVKANDLTRSADFAVKVSGDSMEPTYNDGDILLVEQLPINIGDIGIFILNGDGYVKEFGGDRLISHNKKYPDIKLSEHDVIMCSGRVIGALEENDLDV